MKPPNPAVYECKKSKNTLHYWIREKVGTATCKHCGIKLCVADAEDCFRDY